MDDLPAWNEPIFMVTEEDKAAELDDKKKSEDIPGEGRLAQE